MTTLIKSYDSQGNCTGKCDASCYNAEHPKCTCICGGVNHGKGKRQASQNTRELAEELLKEHSSVEIPAMQLELFNLEDKCE